MPYDITCSCPALGLPCPVASTGLALPCRKYRACPALSQVQGLPCPVASTGLALPRRKFRDTVVLINLRPGVTGQLGELVPSSIRMLGIQVKVRLMQNL